MSETRPATYERAAHWAVRGIVLAYFVAFIAWNFDAPGVPLKLWFGGEPSPRPAVFVVAASFVVGFLLAAFLAWVGWLARAAELRRSRRRVTELESELSRLRNLPIEEDLVAPPAPEAPDLESAGQ